MAHAIGLIGAGAIAQVHAELLARDERVDLCCVYDARPERAAEMALRYGARAAASMEELLERCEAVFLCTPNRTHVELATRVIEAGRHVFLEKPFAVGLEAARELRDCARASGRLFQLGHNRRFAPVYKQLKQAITSGRLAPHSVHARMNRGELVKPSWVWDARLTGGFLYETPVHMFDLMRFFFGEVAWIQAAAHAREHGDLDDFSILLGFASGLHATMTTYAHATWHFPFECFEVFGKYATWETFEMDQLAYTEGLDAPTTRLDFHQDSYHRRWGYEEEDRLFIDALEGKCEVPVTVEEGYRAVELIEAAYASARSGERVALDEFGA